MNPSNLHVEHHAHYDQDSFYKTLTPAQSKLAFANEYDFDSPDVRSMFYSST